MNPHRNGRGAVLASLLAVSAAAGCNNLFGIVGPAEGNAGASGAAGTGGTTGTTTSPGSGGGGSSGSAGAGLCAEPAGPDGTATKWVAHPIGNYTDIGQAIARHPGGDVFVAGYYDSDDFIVKSQPPMPRAGDIDHEDIWVARYAKDTGAALWAAALPGEDTQQVTSMAVDPSGSPVVAGFLLGNFKAGSVTLTADAQYSTQASDGYVVKLDSGSGAVVWAKQLGGASADVITSVATDSQGNILIAGASIPVSDMGMPPATVAVDYGCGTRTLKAEAPWTFLTKLDKDGNCVWDKQYVMDTRFAGIYSKIGLVVAVGPKDEVYLSGGFEGVADFGTAQVTATGSKDVFVLRTAPNGDVLWANNYGDANFQVATALAVDPSGDLWIGGWFGISVTLGDLPIQLDPMADPANSKAFIAKLQADPAKPGKPAEPVYLHALTDAGTLFISSVAVTAGGDAVFGGVVTPAEGAKGVDFGDGKKLPPGDKNVDGTYHDDAFLAKYCKAGGLRWVKHFATANYEQVTGVAVGAEGDTFATGLFDGTNDFGGDKSIMGYGVDPFTLKIGPE